MGDRPIRTERAAKRLLGRGLWADRRGVSAIVIALFLTALLGFAGLAIDVSIWYADKRNAQGAADSAAFSAALDYNKGASSAHAKQNALAVAAQYGFVNGSNGVTITVNNPPSGGTHKSSQNFEVIIQKNETALFTASFINSTNIAARAVGGQNNVGGNYCILVTSTATGSSTMTLSGSAAVTATGCGVQVNSSYSQALYMSGATYLNVGYLGIVGNYGVAYSGLNANITVAKTKSIGDAAQVDPYSSVTVAAAETEEKQESPSGPTTCPNSNTASYGSTTVATINPGVYCGLTIGNSAKVTMNPGVYIIEGGTFTVDGAATLTATSGVTIVLTKNSSGTYATANIGASANVNITAPTTGTTAGLAIYADPASSGLTSTFSGAASFTVTGALDFSSQAISFQGSASSPCLQLIANTLSVSGAANFGASCQGTGTVGIGSTAVQVLE